MQACEEDVREVSRQSIVTARRLAKGQALTPADVTFKRPGLGLEPWRLDDVIGKRVVRDLGEDEVLSEGDVA